MTDETREPTTVILPKDVVLKPFAAFEGLSGGRYLDEVSARRCEATHTLCPDCDQPTDRMICISCNNKRWDKTWSEMPKRPYKGEPVFVYGLGCDEFFFDEDELNNYCEELEIKPGDLHLVHARHRAAPQVDPECLFEEFLPAEDNWLSLPDSVTEGIKALNALIETELNARVWEPVNTAVDPASLGAASVDSSASLR